MTVTFSIWTIAYFVPWVIALVVALLQDKDRSGSSFMSNFDVAVIVSIPSSAVGSLVIFAVHYYGIVKGWWAS